MLKHGAGKLWEFASNYSSKETMNDYLFNWTNENCGPFDGEAGDEDEGETALEAWEREQAEEWNRQAWIAAGPTFDE
jgi:hypothetical protein